MLDIDWVALGLLMGTVLLAALYGLAAIDVGEAPIEESAEEEAAAEPGRVVAETNLTWGIVLGGALLLFLVAGILIWGVGVSYSAAIISQYPVK